MAAASRLRALAPAASRRRRGGRLLPLGPCGSLLPAPLGLAPTPGYCGFGSARVAAGAARTAIRGLLSGCTLRSLSAPRPHARLRRRRAAAVRHPGRGASVLCDPFLVGGADSGRAACRNAPRAHGDPMPASAARRRAQARELRAPCPRLSSRAARSPTATRLRRPGRSNILGRRAILRTVIAGRRHLAGLGSLARGRIDPGL